MIPIQKETLIKAWVAGLKHLEAQADWNDFNIVLSATSPATFGPGDQQAYDAMDSFLKKHDRSVHTVAETIFPGSLYSEHGKKAVYEIYPDEVYPRIKPANPWGTYAHRLVRRTKKGETINPLEIIVDRMKRQLAHKGNKRACYEISLMDAQTDIPIFENETDIGRSMGGPCLSHVSFKLDPVKGKVHLTALYRNHYYIERALGNLMGLARLQYFVANEVRVGIGELVCVSTYAKIDHGSDESPWSKSETKALIGSL